MAEYTMVTEVPLTAMGQLMTDMEQPITAIDQPLTAMDQPMTTTDQPMTTTDHQSVYTETERRIKKACDQVMLLDRKLADLQHRYNAACDAGRRSFRYVLKLRLVTVNNMRNVYYEYACKKAEELMELEVEMRGDSGELEGDMSGDSTEEYEDNSMDY